MAGRPYSRLAAAGVALWAMNADAIGQGLTPFMDRCFARSYDARHLAEHPGQDVTNISIEFMSYGEEAILGTGIFSTRDGKRYAFSGECRSPENTTTLACIVCSLESCDRSDDTFRIVGEGSDVASLLLYNDQTGITAPQFEGPASRWLDPNGEHRVFRLARTDAASCAF